MSTLPFRRRPLIEELEPRLLFSADLVPLAPDTATPAPEQRLLGSNETFAAQTPAVRHELVIVDAGVADYATLLDDIRAQAGDHRQLEVVILDSARDGIAQLSEVLKSYDQLDTLHVIAHGAAGELQLGNQRIDVASLDARASDIAAWRQAFSAEADLLLYGCDIASNPAGEQWIASLSQLTGTDVAASTDLTGNPAQQGDWNLEAQVGAIESSLLLGSAQTVWQGTLNIIPDPAGQTLANATTLNPQATTPSSRQVAINPNDGSFVVVWTGQDASGTGVYLRQFNQAGVAITGEIRVNTTTANDQKNPDLAMNADGDFVVVWQSQSTSGNGIDIYGQRFNAAAVAQGAEFRINATTTGNQTSPSVAINGSGGFVVAWESGDANGSGIYAQRFDSTGAKIQTATEFQVNTTTNLNQTQPAVAMNSSGAFVIVWTSQDQSGDEGQGLYAALYSASGAVVAGKSEFRVSNTTNGNQFSADVAMNTAGNFVVAYTDDSASDLVTSWGSGVYVDVFNNVGTRLASHVLVNQTLPGDQQNPSVALRDTGDFLVTWESESQDGSGYAIVARHFKSDYTAYSSEQIINVETSGDQRAPSVAWNGQQAVFVWSGSGAADSQGVYFRQAEINTPPVITLNGGGNNASVSVLENTTAVTTVTATDIDGHTPSFSLIGGADVSKFIIDPATGVLSFKIAPNYEIPDDTGSNRNYQVTVRVEDGNGGSDTQTLSVNVTDGSDDPVLDNDTYTTSLVSPFSFTVVASDGVLKNDTGADTTGLTAALNTPPSLGNVVVNPDGGFTYTSDSVITGSTSFTYTATNDVGASSTATVYINATLLINNPPTTADVDLGNLDEDTVRVITQTELLRQAMDPDGDNLSIANLAITSGGGTLVKIGSEDWAYTPAQNNTGLVTFSYDISDGAQSTLGNASLNLTAVNDAPTVSSIPDDNATEDASYYFTLSATVFTDIDAGDTLTYTATGLPTWLTFDAGAQTFSGRPDNSDVGTVAITVRATDTSNEWVETTFNLTVVNVNDAPTITSNGGAATANLSVVENSTVVTTLTASDPDTPAQTLSYAIVGGDDQLKFNIDSATGEISFVTAPDYEMPTDFDTNRVYEIVVEARDSAGGTDTQALSIQITDIANTLTVTTPTDVLDGDTSSVEALVASQGADGKISLREAIIASNNTAGADLIVLPSGNYGFALTGSENNNTPDASVNDLDVTDALTIQGAGMGSSVIDANSLHRVFHFHAGSNVTLQDLSLRGGLTDATSGLGGGILMESATATLQRVEVSGNQATYGGGGITVNGSTLSLFDVAISNNTAADYGGGLQISGGGTATLERVTISGNTAGQDGGGIYDYSGGAFSLSNVTISGNTAVDNGGGIFTRRDATLTNVTLAYNTAVSGAGLFLENGPAYSVSVVSTILSNNTGGNSNKTLTSLGYNLDSDGSAGLTGTGDQSGIDPLLGALANNGGVNQTHALLAGSAAINTGAATAPATDQRGTARDALPDIGAYEFVSSGAPVAVSDAATGSEDSPITGNVRSNDTDAENDPLTAVKLSDPANGTLVLNPGGSFSYTPTADFYGSDSFTYKLNDGTQDSNTVTVTLTITPVNDAPVIVSNGGLASAAITQPENTTVVTTVSASDVDLPAQTLSYSLAGGADQSRFSLDAVSGELRFLSAPNYESPDDFNGDGIYDVVVQVTDSQGGSDMQTLAITLVNVNEAPSSAGVVLAPLAEDGTRLITQSDLLAGAIDPDGDLMAATGLAISSGSGALVDHGNGSWTYTPTLNDDTSVSFSYTVSDGSLSASGTATLDITPVNDAPAFTSTAPTTATEDTPYSTRITTADPDTGASLLFSASGLPGWLTLVDHGDGTATLSGTPGNADTGSHSLDITITDGSLSTNQSFILTVNNTNDAPTLTTHGLDTVPGATTPVTGVHLQATDVDHIASELSYVLESQPTQGTLMLNGAALALGSSFTQDDLDNGRVIYTATASISVTEAINLRVTDRLGASAAGVLTVQVTAPARPVVEATAPLREPTPQPESQAAPNEAGAPSEDAALPPVLAPVPTDSGLVVPHGDTASPLADAIAPSRDAVAVTAPAAFVALPPNLPGVVNTPLLTPLGLALKAMNSEVHALESLSLSLGNNSFQQQLDQIQNEIRQQLSLDKNTVASSLAISTGLSVGYVLWLVRGGVLLSSLLSTLPAWRLIDPLPILGTLKRRNEQDDDDSLEGLLKKSSADSEVESAGEKK